MAVVPVKVVEAGPKVQEGKKKKDEPPVDEMDRPTRNDHRHQKQRSRERRELDISPAHIAVAALAQFVLDRADIIAKETLEDVRPRIFGFVVVAVAVDRQPIDRIAIFILSI